MTNKGDNKLENLVNKTTIPDWVINKSETLGLLVNEQSKFVVGNERLRAVLLLAGIGAYFESPIYIAVTGDTQAGKSFLVKKTIELFRTSHFKSGITPKSLIYKCKENNSVLDKAVLCVDDIDNKTSEDVLSTIKQLTNEKKNDKSISYETVANHKYSEIKILGYYTFIFTTADFPGDEQLKSRFLQIPCMLDTHLANQRLNKKLDFYRDKKESEVKEFDFLTKAKKIIDEIIASDYRSVKIPFLDEINTEIFLMNDRILDIFLRLIYNSALFNQKFRQKNEDEKTILADKKDAMIAYDLLIDFFVYNEMDIKITESQKYIMDVLPLESAVEEWTEAYDDKDNTIIHSDNPGLRVSQVEAKLKAAGHVLASKTIYNGLRSLELSGQVGKYKRPKGAGSFYYKLFSTKTRKYKLFKE